MDHRFQTHLWQDGNTARIALLNLDWTTSRKQKNLQIAELCCAILDNEDQNSIGVIIKIDRQHLDSISFCLPIEFYNFMKMQRRFSSKQKEPQTLCAIHFLLLKIQQQADLFFNFPGDNISIIMFCCLPFTHFLLLGK